MHNKSNKENPKFEDLILKITDFGLSRFISNTTLAETRGVGTLIYMAPEIYTDEHYDHKADLWSVGLIFYKAIFKKLPEFLVTFSKKVSYYRIGINFCYSNFGQD